MARRFLDAPAQGGHGGCIFYGNLLSYFSTISSPGYRRHRHDGFTQVADHLYVARDFFHVRRFDKRLTQYHERSIKPALRGKAEAEVIHHGAWVALPAVERLAVVLLGFLVLALFSHRGRGRAGYRHRHGSAPTVYFSSTRLSASSARA